MAGSLIARRSSELAWLVTGPLALLAVSLLPVVAARAAHPVGDWVLGAVFSALFVWADTVRMRFEVRRQSFGVTLNEIPLILGLFLLPPVTLVLARVLATGINQLRRGVAPVKSAFNLASTAACTVLATMVVSMFQPLRAAEPTAWLGLYLAGLVAIFASFAAVTGVITLVQGKIAPKDALTTFVTGVTVGLVNMTVAIVFLVLLSESIWAMLLFVVLVA